jgi:site-specific recombinase XerD
MVTEYMNGCFPGKVGASVSGIWASVNPFYNFLVSEQILRDNPARGVARPCGARYPEIPHQQGSGAVFEQAPVCGPKGYRDHANAGASLCQRIRSVR